jgi:hypothetical protein
LLIHAEGVKPSFGRTTPAKTADVAEGPSRAQIRAHRSLDMHRPRVSRLVYKTAGRIASHALLGGLDRQYV